VRREQRERAEFSARLAAEPLCRWCGKTELQHRPEFVQGPFGPPQRVDRLKLKVECFGWREHFEPAPEAGQR
jgi:hypothetical protein